MPTQRLLTGRSAQFADTGGGAVPASLVVSDTRGDYPLTRVGLEAAIAALPAEGGYIYIGAGTLTIDSMVSIPVNVKLVGAGIKSTIIAIDTSVVAFSLADVAMTVSDVLVTGDGSAGQTFVLNASASDNVLHLERVKIGTSGLDGVEIAFDGDSISRLIKLTDCEFGMVGSAPFLVKDGAGGSLYMSNSKVTGGAISGAIPVLMATSTISSSGDITFAGGTVISASGIAATNITFGLQCQISGSLLSAGTSLSAGANCIFSSCNLPFPLTATGNRVQVVGCNLDSFDTSGFGSHVISGNVFLGIGTTVLLDDSSNCKVNGNVGCLVEETGTSDNNSYSGIDPDSELIGASSIITDIDKYSWLSPGDLTTDATDNSYFARLSPQVDTPVRIITGNVETAPSGAAINVDIRVGTRATGALGAVVATLVIADGAFEGTVTVSPTFVLTPAQFLVAEITQVGSVTPGSTLSIIARG